MNKSFLLVSQILREKDMVGCFGKGCSEDAVQEDNMEEIALSQPATKYLLKRKELASKLVPAFAKKGQAVIGSAGQVIGGK